jgi:hypothetical protein
VCSSDLPPLLSPHYCVGRKKFDRKDGQIFVSRRGGTLENMKVNVKTIFVGARFIAPMRNWEAKYMGAIYRAPTKMVLTLSCKSRFRQGFDFDCHVLKRPPAAADKNLTVFMVKFFSAAAIMGGQQGGL